MEKVKWFQKWPEDKRKQLVKATVMYHVHEARNPQIGPRAHSKCMESILFDTYENNLIKQGNKEDVQLYTLQPDGCTKR